MKKTDLNNGAVLMLIASLAFIGYAILFFFRNFAGGGGLLQQLELLSVHCLGTASVAVNGGHGLRRLLRQSSDFSWHFRITTWGILSLIGSRISAQSIWRRLCSS
jgi:hypothetical protein